MSWIEKYELAKKDPTSFGGLYIAHLFKKYKVEEMISKLSNNSLGEDEKKKSIVHFVFTSL